MCMHAHNRVYIAKTLDASSYFSVKMTEMYVISTLNFVLFNYVTVTNIFLLCTHVCTRMYALCCLEWEMNQTRLKILFLFQPAFYSTTLYRCDVLRCMHANLTRGATGYSSWSVSFCVYSESTHLAMCLYQRYSINTTLKFGRFSGLIYEYKSSISP